MTTKNKETCVPRPIPSPFKYNLKIIEMICKVRDRRLSIFVFFYGFRPLFIVVLDYVLRISLDNMNEKGLMPKPRQSSRNPAQYLTDIGFADDLALISETIKDAESLLQSLEQSANQVGLYCNESKTEFISTSVESPELKSLNGSSIKRVKDFKYLGSHIINTQQ